MREIPKMLGGLLLIALLLAHFFLIALFIAPADKLLGLVIDGDSGFLTPSDIPENVQEFLVANKVEVTGEFPPEQSLKSKLILGILRLRKERFMDGSKKLALDMNLLEYGDNMVGIKAASQHYYKKPTEVLSDQEWITLINLQKIFSKK